MHINAKKMALGGLLLAMTEIFLLLGSVIEMNTLFLLAVASYFIGIMIREAGMGTGIAFYIAGVLLGILLTPNIFMCVLTQPWVFISWPRRRAGVQSES